MAALCGQLDILKYYLEEIKIQPYPVDESELDSASEGEHAGKTLLHYF